MVVLTRSLPAVSVNEYVKRVNIMRPGWCVWLSWAPCSLPNTQLVALGQFNPR